MIMKNVKDNTATTVVNGVSAGFLMNGLHNHINGLNNEDCKQVVDSFINEIDASVARKVIWASMLKDEPQLFEATCCVMKARS